MRLPFLNEYIHFGWSVISDDVVVGQVAIAMFGYMTEIDTVDMSETQEIVADGKY